ncbi:hypothetical protein [Providencia sp. PROV254]|uniref:hypothetical protein n=1 Tax=Providencia sp. PROV254 TaxID=2949942 RepID=UPI00234B2A3B|nr:hypothetical protein [Providencia sp. PROV254]
MVESSKDLLNSFDISFTENASSINKTAINEKTSIEQAEGKDRGKLTTYFVWGFFTLLLWSFLFVLAYNWIAVWWAIDLHEHGMADAASKVTLLELDKVLSLIISALGTPLGFIIGYYFKEKRSS